VIDAAATVIDSKDSEGFNCGILPLSWAEWNETSAVDGIRLSVDGYAMPDISSCEAPDSKNRNCPDLSVIDLYRQKGEAFVKYLRGSFAIVLWDSHQRKLFLATDHFGTRPIYYWLGDHQIAFTPRIGGLAAANEIPKVLDPNSLYFYCNHSFIPAPFTIYKNIHRLEPGHTLEWSSGRSTVKRYWDMTYVEDPGLNEAAAANLLRESLRDSVRFALRSGMIEAENVGAFLSGGTDSSTLVGLMGQLSTKPINSFSVGFEEEIYNEIYYARVAANCFKSIAHECFVRPEEALEAMPVLAAGFDEPFGNSSAMPTYFCLKMANDAGVKVMFAGDGGDELFGGNERYITEKMFSVYQQVPASIRTLLDRSAEILPSYYPWRKVKNYVLKANQPPVDRFFSYQLYFREHAARFLTDEFRASLELDFPIDVARRHYRRAGDVSPLNRLLYVDLKMAVADNDLFKVNRTAERFGIQIRYPYLDPIVGTVSGRIPADLKVKGWSKRYIFKMAFANFLPAEILTKKKHGFGLPTGDWLRSHHGFKELARSLLLDTRSLQRGYFKRSALEGLLKTHDQEPSGYFGAHIWNFMMLELWHRAHADQIMARSF
jgi:asparagine synthase (glutamine-hydrolysing)